MSSILHTLIGAFCVDSCPLIYVPASPVSVPGFRTTHPFITCERGTDKETQLKPINDIKIIPLNNSSVGI